MWPSFFGGSQRFSYFSASLSLLPLFSHFYHSVTGALMSLRGDSFLGCRDC